MKKFNFTIEGDEFEVDIQSVEGNQVVLELNGKTYNVEIRRELKQVKTPVIIRSQVKDVSKEIEKKSGGARTEIKSPLPGVIVKIFVKTGEEVAKNQKLFSLEAMKMENEIKAERDGIIGKILVTPGQSVLQEEVVMEMN